MATRPLPSQEVLRQLLDYDPETGALTWRERGVEWFEGSSRRGPEWAQRNWNSRFAGKRALNCRRHDGYRVGALMWQHVLAHRVIWKWMTGEESISIDHVDGDPSNNSWRNLRNVPHQENMRNTKKHKTNTSGHAGVNRTPKGWRSYIGYAETYQHLGYFEDLEAAVAARKEAEARMGFHENHGRD